MGKLRDKNVVLDLDELHKVCEQCIRGLEIQHDKLRQNEGQQFCALYPSEQGALLLPRLPTAHRYGEHRCDLVA